MADGQILTSRRSASPGYPPPNLPLFNRYPSFLALFFACHMGDSSRTRFAIRCTCLYDSLTIVDILSILCEIRRILLSQAMSSFTAVGLQCDRIRHASLSRSITLSAALCAKLCPGKDVTTQHRARRTPENPPELPFRNPDILGDFWPERRS